MIASGDAPGRAARFTGDEVFERSGQILSQELSGETVLLDLVSEKYFSIDEVGTRVWQLLADGASMNSLLKMLEDEFDVERAQLEGDLRRFLDELLGAGLLRARAVAGDS
jgi:hypothetical protein